MSPRTFAAAAALWTCACGAPDAPRAPPSDEAVGALASGPTGTCADEGAVAFELDDGVTAGGVVRVVWPDLGAPAWLRYVDALGQTRDVAWDGDGATLRGVSTGADVAWRIVHGAAATRCSALQSAAPTPLPAELPELALTLGSEEAIAPAFFAAPILTASRRFLAVLAPSGEVVWAWSPPADLSPDSPIYRVLPRRDGGGLLANVHSSEEGPGAIWDVRWDGTVARTVRVDQMHRDFTELPDGTLAVLAYDGRALEDGAMLRGDQVVTVAPDGQQAVTWSFFDDFDHGLGPTTPVADPDDPALEEYGHANGLSWDEDTDAWLITLPQLGRMDGPRPQGSLLSVDRQTATTNWEVSHTRGDYAVDDSVILFASPHSMQRTDAGVLVYSRGAPDTCSQAVEIALDDASGTAAPVWVSANPDCVHTAFLGDAHRQADGTTVVMSSSAGRLEVVDAAGGPLWRVETDLGAAFGFVDVRGALDGEER